MHVTVFLLIWLSWLFVQYENNVKEFVERVQFIQNRFAVVLSGDDVIACSEKHTGAGMLFIGMMSMASRFQYAGETYVQVII